MSPLVDSPLRNNVYRVSMKPRYFIGPLVFCVGIITFIVFHTHYYDPEAVNNLPWMSIPPFLSSNNHALTPLWFVLWWNFAGHFAEDSFASRFFYLALLNSLLVSSVSAMLADWLYVRTRQWSSAILAGLFPCFAAATFNNATQATQPMLGVFFWFLSFRLLSLDVSSRSACLCAVLSSLLFTIAVGSYQSVLLVGFGMVYWAFRHRKIGILWIILTAASGITLFSIIAMVLGHRWGRELLTYLFTLPGSDIWGVVRLNRLPALVLGITDAIAPFQLPAQWPGWQLGLRQLSLFSLLSISVKVTFIALVIVIIGYYSLTRSKEQRLARTLLIMGSFSLFAPFYWEPYYHKLWIIPLLLLSMLLGEVSALHPLVRKGAWVALGLLVVHNMNAVYLKSHDELNPQARTIRLLEQSVSNNDFLVCDGWDISRVYSVAFPNRRVLPLLFNKQLTIGNIQTVITQQIKNGGQVYIYGLLERDEQHWKWSINNFNNPLEYSFVTEMRRRSELIWRGTERGVVGDLYRVSIDK